MDTKFAIDPAILSTSEPLGALRLCDVRLQSDERFAWIILVPRRAGARELEHLSPADRTRLMEEIILASAAVRAVGAALGRPVEKINVGALGNITAQLHVHVVGRRSDDPAWPGPVWGAGSAKPLSPDRLAQAQAVASGLLGGA